MRSQRAAAKAKAPASSKRKKKSTQPKAEEEEDVKKENSGVKTESQKEGADGDDAILSVLFQTAGAV